MKKLITLALVLACLIAAGSARASHWLVDTTITYDTTQVIDTLVAWDDDGFLYGPPYDSTFRTNGYDILRNSYTPLCTPTFFRFQNVPIAQGAQLVSAILRGYGHASYDTMYGYVFYEDTADATPLQTQAATEITDRTLSADSILWSGVDNGGDWENSPNLISMLQSLFDRADWDSLNSLALIIYASDAQVSREYFVAFTDPSYSPRLLLSWETVNTTYDSLLLGDYSMTWTGKDSVDDTHVIDGLASDSNSSGNVDHLFTMGSYGSGIERHALLRANDFASQFPYDSSYVIWAGWHLKIQSVNGPPDTLYVKELWKPCWIEGTGDETSCGAGGASWHSWSCPSSDWTTPGANSADDDGEYNCGDGTGADRRDTPESFVTNLTAETGMWIRLDVTDLVKRTLAGDVDDSAGVILNVSNGWVSFYSTNADDDGPTYWPIFEITYDLPSEPARKRLPFIRRP